MITNLIKKFMQEETNTEVESEIIETTTEETTIVPKTETVINGCTNCSPEVTDCSVCEKGAVVEGQL